MSKLKFNFQRGKKTNRGTKPHSVRVITKNHSAYVIFLAGMELRREKGNFKTNPLSMDEIKEAEQYLKTKQEYKPK